MVNDTIIDKNKVNLTVELYLAGELYRSEIVDYKEYMKLIQTIKNKYKKRG